MTESEKHEEPDDEEFIAILIHPEAIDSWLIGVVDNYSRSALFSTYMKL